MGIEFDVRLVGTRGEGDGAEIDIEIAPVTGPGKRVFIVLDLSDSCTRTFQHLRKLTWLWQTLPPQWSVSLYALSEKEALHPSGELLHARDLENCIAELEASPDLEERRADFMRRGSFLRYPLIGIYEAWQAERAINNDPSQEALVFVVTDGDFLDFNPIRLPQGMTVMGVLVPAEKGAGSRWSEVLPRSPAYPSGSTELVELVRRSVSPARQMCEILPSFPYVLPDGSSRSTTTPRKKPSSFKWDLGRGPAVIAASASILTDSTAIIECKPRRGEPIQISLVGLSEMMSATTSSSTADIPSATIADGRLVLFNEAAVVPRLVEHMRMQASKGRGLDEQHTAYIRGALSKARKDSRDSASSVEQEWDAAIVVAMRDNIGVEQGPRSAESMSEYTVLVLGGIRKCPKEQLCIRKSDQAPSDPGFRTEQDVRVKYDINSARWHLYRGDERKTLAPRACEAIGDLFMDSSGRVCEVFYTGPLVRS